MIVNNFSSFAYRADISAILWTLPLLLLLSTPCCATWMTLGVSSLSALAAVHHQPETCRGLPGLVYSQIEMCRNNPDAILCVGEGVRRGIIECQQQFRNDRWNCTMDNHNIFGNFVQKGTKEDAFIRAVTNAGVVHAVTQACSHGNLTDCSCDLSHQGVETSDGWKWGGCSDDVSYGVHFASQFVDAQDDEADNVDVPPPVEGVDAGDEELQKLMNLHNNLVGRNSVAKEMQMRCRCHGVSGSCAVKSCWKSMPHFQQVGHILKDKYKKPVEVAPKSKRKLRRREKAYRKLPIEENDLVYAKGSPNFCRRNIELGITGTRGRECSLESQGPENCEHMCCGRGYNTEVIRHVERCHCKFVWCCKVKCKICEKLMDRHTCK